ncbi:Fic family protein [Gordonia amarae]|uniref:Fido domain-containing protein n=2 Tax=Gordonia amarae TaxID=36821 RepID=G7GM29_9ACTN|nr:Fic family protein [Gordonia amarae]MCS3876414.1 Fic family protein [Gordonia amarae]QHN19330.1 Fic family protein [Gordonia amarae]QHN23806.1 Fic family protein [Gordonia amarae]QHN32715.1 Fic family protein [Gordonia amarae]QHN41465.1 Fic family protein [Gordonia amarae]
MSDGQAFGVAVPAVAHETYRWHPSHPEHYSKSEVRRQTGEYRAAVTAAIERWNPSIGAEITADLDEATQALVAFDQYARVRLGADNPTLGPMAAILLRTESASSSQIELLTTSARQLALAEIGEGRKRHALTVIGNVRAMESAIRLSDELSVGTILSMHRELLSRQYGMDEHAGRFRDQLVWIGNRDSAGPLGASFIAPQASLVPPAVDDLVRFMGRDDLPALLQTAVAHAQFETIHPFVDGNGRTGRALAQALLRNKRLAAHTTVPISAGLLTDVERYFDALTAYRSGDATPIIRIFAYAARFAAATGSRLVDSLVAELDRSSELLNGVRSDAAARRLLPLLIGQPVVNSGYVQQRLGINAPAAQRALRTLTERGVVVERTGYARNRIWEHRGIVGALDEYADTIKRSALSG